MNSVYILIGYISLQTRCSLLLSTLFLVGTNKVVCGNEGNCRLWSKTVSVDLSSVSVCASHFSLPSLFITVTTVVIQLETYPTHDCSNIGTRSFPRLESSFSPLSFLFIIIKCTLLLFSAGAKNTSERAARLSLGLLPVFVEARTRQNQETDRPSSLRLPI